MKTFKKPFLVIVAVLVWTSFVGYGFIDGFLLRPITSSNTSTGFIEEVKDLTQEQFVGNLALTIIEDGTISENYFYTTDQDINENSIFPVASISKWVTSFGVLKLIEQGKLDLDTPVDDYLTRWHLPESKFDNRKVTIRKLLSHSSGLIDDLGYSGFALNDTLQTIEESLTKAADAPWSEGVARVGYEPGSEYMYSGAGYTILQLLIEEVTDQSFKDYMQQEVFEPLNMNNSRFGINDKPHPHLVNIYKDDGTIRLPNKFTALAAAGLITTTSDLSKFLIANVSPNSVLQENTIDIMSNPETFINNIGVYGLGPHLYSQKDRKSLIVGHDGSGNNAINTAARIDLKSKNGIIVLETGNHNLASSIADEWIFWKAGIGDYVVMQRNKPFIITLLMIGYIIIFILFYVIFKKYKKDSLTI